MWRCTRSQAQAARIRAPRSRSRVAERQHRPQQGDQVGEQRIGGHGVARAWRRAAQRVEQELRLDARLQRHQRAARSCWRPTRARPPRPGRGARALRRSPVGVDRDRRGRPESACLSRNALGNQAPLRFQPVSRPTPASEPGRSSAHDECDRVGQDCADAVFVGLVGHHGSEDEQQDAAQPAPAEQLGERIRDARPGKRTRRRSARRWRRGC